MSGIPSNIVLSSLSMKRGLTSPIINTASAARGGFRSTGPDAPEFTVSKTDTTTTATIINGYGAESYESRIGSGAWVTGLTVSDLTAETAYTMQVRGIDSDGTGLAASASVTTNAAYNPVGVLFSDSFDDQPDWNSGLPENNFSSNSSGGSSTGGWDVDIEQLAATHTLPVGWDLARATPSYAPSKGDAGKHEVMNITAASTAENPNRARGGTGKSWVTWRDSRQDKQWVSDGILGKYYPEGFDQLYVEFWFNFSNETVATYYNPEFMNATTGIAKLFRIYHWDGFDGTFNFYSDDHPKNPHFIWQFEGRPVANGGYGFRNMLNPLPLRKDPYGNDPAQSKFMHPDGYPSNNIPTSYRSDSLAQFGGSALDDKRDGGLIGTSGSVDIDQVFGDETQWTKVAFFVKMNSVPGAYDGQLIQWIDDRKIIDIPTMQWVATTHNMVKWNVIALGGNDNFFKYPNEDKHEEWYAIDDLVIRDSIPQELI